MKERPILFSGPMVRALLAGTKTQTRRIVKPAPGPEFWDHAGYELVICDDGLMRFAWKEDGKVSPYSPEVRCPYGHRGDRLWVKETVSESEPGTYLGGRLQPSVWYRADNNRPTWADRKWTPSIHCARRLSRITLEITGVRVERLWSITEADAKAEGCTTRTYRDGRGQETAAIAYRSLWIDINGSASWDANPWVWVVEFKRVVPA